MQNKPILKLGRVIVLCVILTSMSPGCLVSSGASLNLIKPNIDTTTDACYADPASDTYFNICGQGQSWQTNAQFAFLYDGDTKAEQAKCLCGRMQDWWGNDHDQTIVLALTTTIKVKTVITTNIPGHYASFSMEAGNSGTFTTLCSPSASPNCIAGSNNFAGTNEALDLSVSLSKLRFFFFKGSSFGLCEVWAYEFKNYAPLSSFTFIWDTSVMDSRSYAVNQAAAPFTYMSSGEMQGVINTDYQFSQYYGHTCTWIKNTATTGNSAVLVTLPYYFEIKEIYHQGDFETQYYLGDPIQTHINTGTASTINTMVDQQNGGAAGKYSQLTGATLAAKKTGVFSAQCTDLACTDWATNKIIITNKEQDDNFFICGFGIMAKIVPCPPTTNQCSHSQLLPIASPIALVSVIVGNSVTTPSFSFPDALTSQCTTVFSQSGCTTGRSYSLTCFKCSGCTTPDTCGGTCPALSAVTFSNSFTSSAASATLTVNPTNVADADIYQCQVSCTFNSMTMASNQFQLNICLTCSSAVLTNTATVITAFTPSFPNLIAVGTTGATSSFTAPTNSVTLCSGESCPGMSYSIKCKDQSNSGAVFAALSYFSAVFDQTNPTTPRLKVFGTLTAQLHGIIWDCQITAALGTSPPLTSNTFTVQFDMCISPAESCPHGNLWQRPTDQNPSWVAPLDIIVYPDNKPVSTTLDYTRWKDYFNNNCMSNFCGTPTYSFYDSTNSQPPNFRSLNFVAAVTTSDDGAGTVTFTVTTNDNQLAGIYYVGIRATLANDVSWVGTRPTSIWAQFQVTIIDPCGPPIQCKYTKLVAPTVVQTAMTISVGGPSQSQSFPLLDDVVSVMCHTTCSLGARSYALMYTGSNLQVPSDLATIDSTTLMISAQTSNWAYSGTHTVYVLATISLTYFLGEGSQSVKGNDFTITVDPCVSCAKTTFIALGTGDTQPASYSIGVENTPGQTLFSPFQNQAAKYCLNPTQSLCGTPTYAIQCVSGCPLNQAPPFSQSITVDASLKMKQSSWTIDYTLAGTYTVKIVATLDLSTFGQNTPITISTNNYVITINACVPLPCQYNQIIAPVITGGTNHLPQTQVVLCNNTIISDYFSAYTDMVSTRCSGTTYTDKCGPKNYVIENSPSGTALPFTVSITQSGTNTNQLTNIATSDCSLVDIYNVQIHASFTTPTVTFSDNTDVKFIISVEYPDPCKPIICAANTFSLLDPVKDKFPSDFTVWVNNTWGTTNFTNFRDKKTDQCAGLPGAWPNGTLVASFTAPICGYPTYQIKVVSSGANLDSVFGSSNVVLVQTGALDWQLQVRTSNKALAGVYEIQIVGTLLGISITQPSFNLTVLDECNPYNCSLTQFYPMPNGLKPTDITVKVGQGFVTSNQALWTDLVTAKCSNAALGQLCGQTQFLLLLSDGSPVPFTYTVSQSSTQTQVSVEITDPLLIGTIFDVYLQGYGLDSNGLPFGLGSSSLFKITVIEADSTDYGSLTKSYNPQFDTFPEDQTFLTNTTYNSYTVEATASVQNGTIVSISASLGSATSFVSITNQSGQISFKITYNIKIPLGDYVIKVTAEDEKGAKVSKSFKITIKNPVIFVAPNLAVQQKEEMKQILEQMKSSNTTDTTPVTAVIESVSINGVVEIKFSAAVVPVSDVAQLSIDEVYLVYEQNSFEADQTFSFTWTVVKSTPFKLFIQLNFLQPLDISQGTLSDRIRVWLKRDILMIKDTIGMYKGWVDRYNSTQKTIIKANPLIQFEYQNVEEYWNMVKNIPQQVEDVPAGIFLVNYNLNNVQLVTQTMFWIPLILQIAVPQAMEKTWLMFGSLQVFNLATQMNLKTPANVVGLAMYLQKTANSQFFDNYSLYGWLRSLASDRNVSNPTNSTQINSTSRILNAINSNTSEYSQAKTTSFQDSRFYGHGSTEKVIESSSQMLIALFLVSMVFLSLMFFQKYLMYWFPARFKEAFHSIKRRFYFSLPLRILSQQYMQVSLGALINVKLNSDRQSTEQKVNYGISVTIIMLYSLLFPAWIIYFIRKHRQIVTTDHIFIKEWNTLFLKVDLRKYQALFLLAYNLIRRFLLMYVAVNIKFPLLQLISVLYIQTTFALYVMLVWPMEDTVDNQSLIFNELILTAICVILFSFTQYVPDSKIRYELGWFTIYLIYLLILITSGVWAVDFYKMLRRQFLILRQKYRLFQRKQKVVQHNKIVDVIGRHRPQEKNIMFKRRNGLVTGQLEEIESLGDQEISDQADVSIGIDAHAKTIAARKLEFQQQMTEMKKRNDFNEDVIVQQVLNNLPMDDSKKQEQNQIATDFDDIFRDLLPAPLSRRKIQQQVQQESDWPVSPRHAHVLKKMEIPIERQEQWSWDNEVQGSNISQWNALPDDFSYQNSDKSWGGDEFKPKNKHVGKIQKLNTKKEGDQKNQWGSMDYLNRSQRSSAALNKDDFSVYK